MGSLLRAHRLLVLLVTLLGLLALVGGGVLLLFGGSARAEEESATGEVRILRELPELRGAYQSTYLLSNGQYRSVFSQAPVHYEDERGEWQPIDLTLKTEADGTVTTTAAAVTVRFTSDPAAPVVIECAAGRVTLDLLAATEGAPVVDGGEVLYPAVDPEVDVRYEPTGDGVKETLVLASAKAPSEFTYAVAHAGFELREDAEGVWGLYAADAKQPAFEVGPLTVFDSSSDEGEMPAFCEGAQMTIEPGKGASTITYVVPEKWLRDPARIFPVMVDPQLFTRNPTDTYISAGYPGTAYGSSEELLCGKVSAATGDCRTLVKFPQLTNIDSGAHIAAATFSIRQFWQPTTHSDTVNVGRVGNGSTNWGNASTWNSTTLDIASMPSKTTTAMQQWVDIPCTTQVQGWVRGSYANKGFVLHESPTAGSSWARKFRSGEYSNADFRPKLTVDWEIPSAAPVSDLSAYHIGSRVEVQVNISTPNAPYTVADPSQVRDIRMHINRTDQDSSRRRGFFAWFRDVPTGAGWVYERARNTNEALDGYIAYYSTLESGIEKITPLLSESRIAPDRSFVTFVFEVGEEWGDIGASQMDTRLAMDAGALLWTTDWVSQTTPSFIVDHDVGVPAALTCLSATTEGGGWFSGPGTNDTTDEGRGSVTLSWPEVPLADRYDVHLWDGDKYNPVGSTAQTSWTSAGKDLFPTDSAIAAIAPGYEDDPFDAYGSRELRDDPSPLYEKMGASAPLDTDYRFVVVPVNTAGEEELAPSFEECAPLRVTLDNRTVTESEDPQHVDHDLTSWLDHDFGCELDSGTLTAFTTDLAIASFGPSAALSRSYRSDVTAAGLYAPGWFFSFEQSLDIDVGEITYTDAFQRTHTFMGSGSSWSAPNGFLASLTPSGSDWELTFFDQSALVFDGSGVLVAERDAHGNETTYTWASGQLTEITAENGQEIDLTWDAGKLTSASYQTGDGTRTVTYGGSGSAWVATLYPGTDCERELTYGYDGNARIEVLSLADWPSQGQSVAMGFLYTTGDLTEVRFADCDAQTKPDARATITYATNEATIERYGTVDGVANQPMNREVLTWRGPVAGVPGQLTSRTVGSGDLAVTYTYGYAFDRQLATSASSEGGLSSETYSLAHDLTSTTQTTEDLAADNQTATYTYDAQHRVTCERSYQSPTHYAQTQNTYSGADLTAVEVTDEGGALRAASQHTYDTAGRLTRTKEWVSGPKQGGVWTQTDFSDFAACGEPQTETATGIKLSSAGTAQDLTRRRSYDAFGNLLTQSTWGGRTTETTTYDICGNRLTSTNAAAIVSRSVYDRMGNAIESYRTAAGTQMKADWQSSTHDAVGNALTETTRRSDASGNPTTDSVVTTSYDGSGNELTSADSTVGGQTGESRYDASANLTQGWALGVLNKTDAERSTRSVYDPEGNLLFESRPGNANAPGAGVPCEATTYDDTGNELSSRRPDGSATLSAYDGAANEVAREGEGTSSAFSPWDEAKRYDGVGNLVETTDPQQSHTGLVTQAAHDGLNRETTAIAQRDGLALTPTQTTYNHLGWVLASLDANGVTTENTYNAHGELTSKTIGTRTTTYSYDATTGRLMTMTLADGTTVTYSYDVFGNVTGEHHQTAGALTLKHTTRTYDSLARTLSEGESVAATSRTWTYPQNAATGIQESLTYGPSPNTSLQISRNARNMETSRVATIAANTTVTLTTADTTSGRDTADRWKQRTIQRTGYSAKTQNRTIDAAGRLATQSGLGFSAAASYTYDPETGRKTAESLPLALGGTLTASYAYYPGGDLATATISAGSVSYSSAYSFDEVGNFISETTDAGEMKLSYDAANRLQSRQHTPADPDEPTELTAYGWDESNAWRTSQGPQSNPTQVQMSYSPLGRMASYTAQGTSATYTYDAHGQRTKSTVTVSGVTTTTTYAYEGLTLLSLTATQGASSWRIDYLHDEEGTPYGGVYRSPSGSTSPTYFTMITTDRGDVALLCDGNGGVFAAYRYDAWGSPLGAGNYATGIWTQSTALVSSSLAGQIASRQILRYAGYAYDAESGFYYCSARYYDPATRQWTTGDPAKANREQSAYQYCRNNPIAGIDPSGLYVKTATRKIKVLSNKANYDTSTWVIKVYVGYTHQWAKWLVQEVYYSLPVTGWLESSYRRGKLLEWSADKWIKRDGFEDKNPAYYSNEVTGDPTVFSWKPAKKKATARWHYKNGKKVGSTKVTFKHELHFGLGSEYEKGLFSGYYAGTITLPVK